MVTLGEVPAATAAVTFWPKVKKSTAVSATLSWGSLDFSAASAWSSHVRDGPLLQMCQNSTALPEVVGAAAALETAEVAWFAVVLVTADVTDDTAEDVDAVVARLVAAALLEAVLGAIDVGPPVVVLEVPEIVAAPPQLLSVNAAPTPAAARSNDRRLRTVRPIPRTLAPVFSISLVSLRDTRSGHCRGNVRVYRVHYSAGGGVSLPGRRLLSSSA
jgi:hypothetical protein